MIKAKDVVFEYQKYDEEGNVCETKRAVDGVALDVKKGEFSAILGHNGSGKSTLAKHLNALLLPSDGEIWVAGMNTKEEAHVWDIRQSAGMVFQNPDNQIIGTVVEEDVGFGPENMGIPTQEIWERVEEALKAVGMYKYRKHSPNRLSGGQKQRVAIAGIVAMHPQCIVLDEPTAMLDPRGRKEVMDTVLALNKEKGITVVLITHHMDEAARAGRVVVLHKGSVALDGTPQEVFARTDVLHGIGLAAPETVELCFALREAGYQLPLTALDTENCAQALFDFVKA